MSQIELEIKIEMAQIELEIKKERWHR